MSLPAPPFTGDESRRPGMGLPSVPQRLHPLSPVVRIGRAAIAFVYIAGYTIIEARSGKHSGYGIDIFLLVATVLAGVISWAVTTWAVEGTTLHVSTGLIRRKVIRLPLSRVQAVDLVEPWLARLLGLAEVRVRTGGGGAGDARLQYLRLSDAQAVRTALVALAHGLPGTTPAAEERLLIQIDNGLLVGSSALTARTLSVLAVVGVELFLVLDHLAVAASTLVIYVLAMIGSLAKRIANEWGLTVSESPDGLRLKTGLGSRLRETIPPNRIQAVHHVEPLFWRLFSWKRLELHLAGGVSRRRNQPSAVVRRSLLPVGRPGEPEMLLRRLLGRESVAMSPPPVRGRIRSPLSFHFLAAGHDGVIAMSTSGRVCRRTDMVPLAKVQSVHFVQGPLLRALRLATVRVHAAGRGATVAWRQRDEIEARVLVDELAVACAAARELERGARERGRGARERERGARERERPARGG
ncbi:MAG: PH domain-containing protein [Acidimicrobiales bacterium]